MTARSMSRRRERARDLYSTGRVARTAERVGEAGREWARQQREETDHRECEEETSAGWRPRESVMPGLDAGTGELVMPVTGES